MRALVFDGGLRIESNYPAPRLVPGEAIIQTHLAGICNTDLEIIRGYMGFQGILGHEFVGTVTECEQADWIGKRVVGEINAACFSCPTCLRGDQSHCPERTTLGISKRDGAMAEYCSLPIPCLHEVPASIPNSVAVFVEPVAAALEILEQTHIRPTDRIALIGDGKLGIISAQVLCLPGAQVTLYGRHPERWSWLQKMGIQTINSGEEYYQFALASYDLVVDCTGHPAGLALAHKLVRPRGRLVVKSTFAANSRLDLTRIVVDEVQLIGSRCGPFDAALRILERELVEVEPLIAARFPLSEGLEAMTFAEHRLKVLLEITDG